MIKITSFLETIRVNSIGEFQKPSTMTFKDKLKIEFF